MKQDIKNKIKLLKMVRVSIEDRTEYFICNAISRITEGHSNYDLRTAGNYLKDYISESLNAKHDKGYYDVITTFDIWLKRYRPERYERGFGIQIRQARLEWIDWMINCYEEDFK